MPADIVETTVMGDFTFVKAVTPPDGYNTSSDGPSIPAKDIKAYRESLIIACSFCHKSFRYKLVCAKCKVAAYCSKECQKKQWPLHKFVCQESKAAAKLKLVTTLMSIPRFELTLMSTFAFTFGLHKKMILDRPLIMQCDLAVDAADMSIIFSLTSGKQTPDDYPDGVEGMLQLKWFSPLDPAVVIDPGRRKIWEEARAKNHVKRRAPIGKYVTGLIDFHMEGTDQVITMPLNIADQAIALSRMVAGGVCAQDPVLRHEINVPFSPRVAIGTMDMIIRDDKKNHLRLRTHMPKEALYKYVGNNINEHDLDMLPTTTYATKDGKRIKTAVPRLNGPY
ncbi:hypothetical protein HYPSUDRAFT_213177 [Hypholoma sublateritium FD-334 SS-4]|uniref:MYND-type domain-containing protein n=1 Tax=Hypholoma sublateritium (strain FD-334 SS-4) TaxID=945553 RepID=A0A0D2MRG0_HYPSF|nr:hypothetical protein HYPSUDRAFT_213177 [Hypholoma sublateritium FD-334 SS-4]